MDSRLLFLHHSYGGKGGTRQGEPSIPNGHGVSLTQGKAGAGKSTPDVIAQGEGKLRGDPRRFGRSHTVKKSLVVVEIRVPVPQTDSGE